MLKHYISGDFSEYSSVELSKNGDSHKTMIHRLVYQSFVGEIPYGMEVDHIDDDSTNNCVENLQVLTKPDNVRKSYIKTKHRKHKSNSYILVNTLNNDERTYRTSGEISILLNICTTHIRNCAMGRGTGRLLRGIYKIIPKVYKNN